MTNTGDSTTVFTIENIKAGRYKLVALKDENTDNKFQQKSDKIAFYDEIITVGQDSVFYDLELFKEAVNFKATKPRLVSGEKIAFGFEGNYKEMEIKNISKTPKDFNASVIKEYDKDTLLYYYSPKLKVDSLLFQVKSHKTIDTFTVRIKENLKDSLVITSLNKGKINFEDDLKLYANTPFKRIDERKITILDKDSTKVRFTTSLDSLNNVYRFKFNLTEDNRYNIQALPEAFTDFFDRKNDTLNTSVSTSKYASFGDIRIRLTNEIYPLFIQFVDDKNEVQYSQYLTKSQKIDFNNIVPNTYYLRVLFDENKNGVYDSGNYLRHEQPERVSYSNKPLEVRAGWEEVIDFKLDKE